MTRRPFYDEDPDRLYTITGGRSRVTAKNLDLVTLLVSNGRPQPGMQSEHATILRICRHRMAVVEIAAHLGLPVSVVKILLGDLIDSGQLTALHPSSVRDSGFRADPELLKKVLVGLQNL